MEGRAPDDYELRPGRCAATGPASSAGGVAMLRDRSDTAESAQHEIELLLIPSGEEEVGHEHPDGANHKSARENLHLPVTRIREGFHSLPGYSQRRGEKKCEQHESHHAELCEHMEIRVVDHVIEDDI